ncbi:hypothetical protein MAR_032655 [Mya arenaria]|uniref:Uncharacterized protein n=1 Tax=Mya arenaria TaxID=6604 RepID=A0ABY7FAQ8_MYAAR|nr:hypothetical protein MAR_032631 [Mya arenaria]WAR18061.1 hypothetical protein MAR_032655 [Mya arenaria]
MYLLGNYISSDAETMEPEVTYVPFYLTHIGFAVVKGHKKIAEYTTQPTEKVGAVYSYVEPGLYINCWSLVNQLYANVGTTRTTQEDEKLLVDEEPDDGEDYEEVEFYTKIYTNATTTEHIKQQIDSMALPDDISHSEFLPKGPDMRHHENYKKLSEQGKEVKEVKSCIEEMTTKDSNCHLQKKIELAKAHLKPIITRNATTSAVNTNKGSPGVETHNILPGAETQNPLVVAKTKVISPAANTNKASPEEETNEIHPGTGIHNAHLVAETKSKSPTNKLKTPPTRLPKPKRFDGFKPNPANKSTEIKGLVPPESHIKPNSDVSDISPAARNARPSAKVIPITVKPDAQYIVGGIMEKNPDLPFLLSLDQKMYVLYQCVKLLATWDFYILVVMQKPS